MSKASVSATTPKSGKRKVGDVWEIGVKTSGSSDAPVVHVGGAGAPLNVEPDGEGGYRAFYVVEKPGRQSANVTVGDSDPLEFTINAEPATDTPVADNEKE
jgi:hypothetical protein